MFFWIFFSGYYRWGFLFEIGLNVQGQLNPPPSPLPGAGVLPFPIPYSLLNPPPSPLPGVGVLPFPIPYSLLNPPPSPLPGVGVLAFPIPHSLLNPPPSPLPRVGVLPFPIPIPIPYPLTQNSTLKTQNLDGGAVQKAMTIH